MPYATEQNGAPRWQNRGKEPRTGPPRYPRPHDPNEARRGPHSEWSHMAHPLADTRVPEWITAALCSQTDPELFHPAKGGSSVQAKRVCRACPVQALCLAYAIADPTLEGVWGGTTPMERRTLRIGAVA